MPEKKETVAGRRHAGVARDSAAGRRQVQAVARQPASRRKNRQDIAVWVVSAAVAAIFFGAGGSKLGSGVQAVETFARFGYPDSFRPIVALLELGGAVALLVPKTALYGVIGLGLVMVGAVYSHLSIEEWPQAIVPLLLLLALAWIGLSRRETAARQRSG